MSLFTTAGGGATQLTGYEVSNSIRFNDNDSQVLNRQFDSDPTSRKTFTFSAWVKKTIQSTGSGQGPTLFSAQTTSNFRSRIYFDNDTFRIQNHSSGSQDILGRITHSLRDTNAWYHLVWAMDTTQADGNNGMKLYINGVEQSISVSTYNQNATFEFARNGTTTSVGRDNEGSYNYFDGYVAEVNYIDGQQLAPTEFGEINNEGIWVPKEYKGTYGNNGFFLEFKQTGTGGDSSSMGADTSGNDNHFTPDNLAAKDVVVDTPTNNFMLMNPLFTNSRGTFREGNTQVVTNVQGSDPYGQVEFGNMHLNTGKWYFEVRPTTIGSGGSLGLGVNERAYENTYTNGHNNGGSSGNIRWNHSTGAVHDGSVGSTAGATYANDDILGFAMDLDNNKIYCHKNGTYVNSGDPAAGSNGITMTSAYSDYWTPWMSKDDTTHNATVDFNFGNPQFAISSSNSDANGYGNFEYAVPSGFYAICTKNIAKYG